MHVPAAALCILFETEVNLLFAARVTGYELFVRPSLVQPDVCWHLLLLNLSPGCFLGKAHVLLGNRHL